MRWSPILGEVVTLNLGVSQLIMHDPLLYSFMDNLVQFVNDLLMQEFSSSLCLEIVMMVTMVILSSGSVTPSPGSLVLTILSSPALTQTLPSHVRVWCLEATTLMWTRAAKCFMSASSRRRRSGHPSSVPMGQFSPRSEEAINSPLVISLHLYIFAGQICL